MPETLKSRTEITNHLISSETFLNNYTHTIKNNNSVYLSLYPSFDNESILVYHNQIFVDNFVSNPFVNNLNYFGEYFSEFYIFSGKCNLINL